MLLSTLGLWVDLGHTSLPCPTAQPNSFKVMAMEVFRFMCRSAVVRARLRSSYINRLAPGQVISPSMDSLAGSSESNPWTLDDRGRLLHTWSILLERNILSNQPVRLAFSQSNMYVNQRSPKPRKPPRNPIGESTRPSGTRYGFCER
jgi:hypothetical protein